MLPNELAGSWSAYLSVITFTAVGAGVVTGGVVVAVVVGFGVVAAGGVAAGVVGVGFAPPQAASKGRAAKTRIKQMLPIMVSIFFLFKRILLKANKSIKLLSISVGR